MKQLSRFSICLCFLFYTHLALALDEIEVVTLNQYLGADLAPVLATSPEEFNDALVGVLQKVSASDFKTRVLEQARMIAKRSPQIDPLVRRWQRGQIYVSSPLGHGDPVEGYVQGPGIGRAHTFGDSMEPLHHGTSRHRVDRPHDRQLPPGDVGVSEPSRIVRRVHEARHDGDAGSERRQPADDVRLEQRGVNDVRALLPDESSQLS